jgi:hypothetical protein
VDWFFSNEHSVLDDEIATKYSNSGSSFIRSQQPRRQSLKNRQLIDSSAADAMRECDRRAAENGEQGESRQTRVPRRNLQLIDPK